MRFASRPSTRHVPGCKRWALCVRPAGITSLGVKMYRKETAVYTQNVFMGMNPVRKARKETERGDRYGRGQRIRARSFNQPANHRTIRPTSPQRSKHLTLNSPYHQQGGKEKEKREDSRARKMRQGKQSGKRKSGCLTPSPPRSTNGRVTVSSRQYELGTRVQSYREIGVSERRRIAARGVGPSELSSQRRS